jgi:hypothetical protein
VLTKIRETRRGVDAAFLHGGLVGAKREYPHGLTMEDVLKDFKFGQLTNATIKGSVLIDMVKESHDRGWNFSLFWKTHQVQVKESTTYKLILVSKSILALTK